MRRDLIESPQNRGLVKQNPLQIGLHLGNALGHFATQRSTHEGFGNDLAIIARGAALRTVTKQMRVHSGSLAIKTSGKGTYEITDEIQDKIDRSGVRNGTVTVFVQHTSCSLTAMENAASAARRDLEKFFDKLVPEGQDFEHDDEGPDDMPSHIRMALTRTSETIPIVDGKMQLGTWQGIFLFEHRRDSHRRKIALAIIGE